MRGKGRAAPPVEHLEVTAVEARRRMVVRAALQGRAVLPKALEAGQQRTCSPR